MEQVKASARSAGARKRWLAKSKGFGCRTLAARAVFIDGMSGIGTASPSLEPNTDLRTQQHWSPLTKRTH
jgi:hypothetical protein